MRKCDTLIIDYNSNNMFIAQSAGAVEYTDCFYAEA